MKYVTAFLILIITANSRTLFATNEFIPVYTYDIINSYPHDQNAFTQGLVYQNGYIYESTGRHGSSSLRKVDLQSGEVIQISSLPNRFFGEGITIFHDKIIQLTWKSRVGFAYDKESFNFLHGFSYVTEGWGITDDNNHLIMSDGSPRLYFLDPDNFKIINIVRVFDNNGPVSNLNELEYISGEVFANVWQTNRIARINPKTGQVTGWIDLEGLLSKDDHTQPVDVLNGIAYDKKNDRLFVTGKLWPKLFEIKLHIQLPRLISPRTAE